MSDVNHSSALPAAMKQKLRSIGRRQALLAVVRAAAFAVSVLIAAMLVVMLADWALTLFDTGVRTVLTMAAIGAAVVVLAVAGVPALRSAIAWNRAAIDADDEVPQLEERWTTVASFSRSVHQPQTETARAMLQQVTSEAVAMGRLVRPSKVARPESVRPAALMLAGCAAVLVVFLAVNWPRTSVLLQRFWSPRANITATILTCETGDVEIPRGESLALTATLSGLRTETATIEMESGAGIVDVLDVLRDEERPDAFVHEVTVENSFRYRVRSGDSRTPWYRVTAIDFPSFAAVRMTVTAPDYVNRPPYEKSLIPSRVKVFQGSRLELLMKPAAPLERLELSLKRDGGEEAKAAEQRLVLNPDDDGWYRYETQLMEDLTFSPTLLNSHGLTDEDRRVCRIQVVADKAPVARIISPTAPLLNDERGAAAIDDVIDIKFEAHDDHGIATAELVVYDESATADGGEPKILSVQPIELGEQELKQHVMGEARLDLARLGLEEGANISYAIRVTDNRMVQAHPRDFAAKLAKTESNKQVRDNQPEVAGEGTSQGRKPNPSNEGLENTIADAGSVPRGSVNRGDEEKPRLVDSDTKLAGEETPESKNSTAEEKAGTESGKPGDVNDSAKPQSQAEEIQDANEGTDDSPAPKPSDGEQPERNAKPAADGSPQEGSESRTTAVAENGLDAKEKKDAAENASRNRKQRGEPDGENESPERTVAMSPQQAESGQNMETGRRRLKITARLSAVAAATARKATRETIRDAIVQIDEMLAAAEGGLAKLVNREIADADRSEQFARLDKQMGEVEKFIADMRDETREGQFAFVGLQMVDVSRSHVTPARDRVFIGIRQPLGAGNDSFPLQEVVRARELLSGLMKRYERVARDKELKESLDEAVKMYTVYVEKTHQLMREAQQNRNPLKRKMEIIEVDQEYLDRYAEVLKLRREMMAEFARILADDPRLMSRYLDLIGRRRQSMIAGLTGLLEQQEELATEVSGWARADDAQRADFWPIVADLRLQVTTPLAKQGAELSEHIDKQLPLVLEAERGTAALVVGHAARIAALSREISFDTRKWAKQNGEDKSWSFLTKAELLAFEFAELDAALDRLRFENEDVAEVTSFVDKSVLESRTVADLADSWLELAGHIEARRYPGLAEVDQQRIGLETELLRVEMLNLQEQLQNQFERAGASEVPAEILKMVGDLQALVEGITFNQSAATFALTKEDLPLAEAQQAKAMDGFDRAKDLLNAIRRAVAAELDQYAGPPPNIADLRDPTLDEFLARLEREPNLEARLGIPNRPRNLRVMAETMTWEMEGGDLISAAGEAANQRMRDIMREQKPKRNKPDNPEREMSQEERDQLAKSRDMREMLERSLASIREKAEDPKTPAGQRDKLEEMANNMQRMLDDGRRPPFQNEKGADDEEWTRIAESENVKEILKALARGEAVPDGQWNKLLSTLDDGLWQVKGRTPPEEFRKAIEQYQNRIRQLAGEDGE